MSNTDGPQAKKQKLQKQESWELADACPPMNIITREQFRAGFADSVPSNFIESARAYGQMIHFTEGWHRLQQRYHNLYSTYRQQLWSSEVKPVYGPRFPSHGSCILGVTAFIRYRNEARAAGNEPVLQEASAILADWISCTMNKYGYQLHAMGFVNLKQDFEEALDTLEKEASDQSQSQMAQQSKQRVTPSQAGSSTLQPVTFPASSPFNVSSDSRLTEVAPSAPADASSASGIENLHKELDDIVLQWECDLADHTVLPWESFAYLGRQQAEIKRFSKLVTRWHGDARDQPSNGILLYGPPGVGKTAFVLTAGKELGLPVFLVGAGDLKHHLYSFTERLVKSLFRVVRQRAPCILFFDEFDGLCGQSDSRTSSTDDGLCSTLKVEWGQLITDRCPVMIYATTITPWKIETGPGLWGRLKTRVHIDLPDQPLIVSMLERYFETRPNILTKEDLEQISGWLRGGSHADVISFFSTIRQTQQKLAIEAGNWTEGIFRHKKYLFPAPRNQVAKLYVEQSAEDRAMISHAMIDMNMVKEALRDGLFEITVLPEQVQRYIDWTRRLQGGVAM